jgi:hypothetical protein
MAYRYWCGECGFKTGWLAESQGAQQQVEHYLQRHPGIPPGGHMEINQRTPGGGNGCLQAIGILVLLLFLAVACRR